jgi:hypothetical protein
MFKSLTDMLRTPIVLRPYLDTDTVGDKTYGENITILCCIEPRVTILPTVKTGVQDISEGLLYINGVTKITTDDLFIFEGRTHNVKRLWAEYEGPEVSLWVVYF